jgi:predicted nuclease of predicted toxin-antitoxin system
MKFIADENIPLSLIKAIRKKSYSITCLKEENLLVISDSKLIEIANNEKRVLITFDKDFTDLFRYPIEKNHGVVILRYKNKHPRNVVTKFLYVLDLPVKDSFENSLCEIFDGYLKINKE